jgi:uncharacterized integral membrane protein
MRRHEDLDPTEDDRDPQRVRRSGMDPRWIGAGIVALVLVIFATQNSERVDVDFLFFDAQVRVVTVIVVSALLGFVIGWFVGRPNRRERKGKD